MIRPFFCSGIVFVNAAQVDSLIKSILIKQLVLWLCWHWLQAATCLFSPTPSTLRKHRIKVRTSSDSWSWRMWMWKSRERGRRLTSSSQERRFQFLQQDLSVSDRSFCTSHCLPGFFMYCLSLQSLVHLWKSTDDLFPVCLQLVSLLVECEPSGLDLPDEHLFVKAKTKRSLKDVCLLSCLQ